MAIESTIVLDNEYGFDRDALVVCGATGCRYEKNDKDESPLECVNRYTAAACTFASAQLHEGGKAEILFQNLPRMLQQQLAI